jgi:hypothetical protein
MIPVVQSPFNFKFESKQGGAFIAIGHRGAYTAAMPAGAILGAYRWLDSDYVMAILGFDFAIEATADPTTAGTVKLSIKKTTNITADPTGASPLTTFATPKRSSMMSDAALMTHLRVINAPAGAAGLVAGTRTVSNEIMSPFAYIEKKGGFVATTPGELLINQAEPFYLEKNEGLELSLREAPPAGISFNIHTTLRFLVIPKEVCDAFIG